MQEFVSHCERRFYKSSVSKKEIFHKSWIHIVLHLNQLLHEPIWCALKELYTVFVNKEHSKFHKLFKPISQICYLDLKEKRACY